MMPNLSQLVELLGSTELEQFIRQSNIETFSQFVDYLYDSIDEAINDIQENKDHFLISDQENGGLKIKSEDSVTYAICMYLRSRKIDAEHDASSNGNPDIKVKWKGHAWLGEAKIAKSNTDSMEGWRQLVDRYSTGEPKNCFGGLLLYFSQSNVAERISVWRDFLAERVELTKVEDCQKRPSLSFISEMPHPVSHSPYFVRHMPVMLLFEPSDKSARASRKHKAG